MKKELIVGIINIIVVSNLSIWFSYPVENGLADVKVACLYERVTDGIYYLNRSIDDVICILKETKTDFIFRGWWRWSPCPDSPNTTLPPEYPPNYVENCVKRGYTKNYKASMESSNKGIFWNK